MTENTTEKNISPLTSGSIYIPLVKFMLPILLALFLQAMYSAVDLMVIGRFSSTDATVTQNATSAVGTGSMVMVLVTYVISGLSMGANIVLGRYIGANDKDGASKTVGAAICIFGVLSIVLTIIMEIFATQFAVLMSAPDVELCALYLRICGSGTLFIVAYNVISGIFRGIGNSRLPLIFVGVACVVNIGLDLLTVCVFGWGVAGVAVSTITAQAVSVVLSLIVMKRISLPFTVSLKNIRFHKGITADILKTGIPLSLQDFLTNMSFIIINAVANNLGPDETLWTAIASGYALDNKITVFLMVLPSAFIQTMAVFTAQNIGAKEYGRIKKGLIYMLATAFVAGLCLAALAFFGGKWLARIFTTDEETIYYASMYLKGFSIDCLVGGMALTLLGYLNGSGHTTFVMVQGLIAALAVRIPVILLMSQWNNVNLLYLGIGCASATICTLIMAIAFYFIKGRHLSKNTAD